MKLFALCTLACAATALAQPADNSLLVCDSTADTVSIHEPDTGSYVQFFCSIPQIYGTARLPKEALRVGSEVWVSDQSQGNIMRFDLEGTYLGDFAGPPQGLNNVRGFEVADGKCWATCGSGTYAGNVVVFDQATGAFLFAVNVGGSPFDCTLVNGEILVPNSSTGDIDRVGLDGSVLGKFVDSVSADNPLDFPQQVRVTGQDILVAEFSGTFEFFRFDAYGTLLQSVDTSPVGGLRSVFRLNNGDYFITNGTGGHVFNGSTSTVVFTGSGQYINRFGPPCVADFNNDGFPDAIDYDNFVSMWLASDPGADMNADTFIDAIDYDIFVSSFVSGC